MYVNVITRSLSLCGEVVPLDCPWRRSEHVVAVDFSPPSFDAVELSFGGCVIDTGKWLGEQGGASGTVLLSFVVGTLSCVLDHRYHQTENPSCVFSLFIIVPY